MTTTITVDVSPSGSTAVTTIMVASVASSVFSSSELVTVGSSGRVLGQSTKRELQAAVVTVADVKQLVISPTQAGAVTVVSPAVYLTWA